MIPVARMLSRGVEKVLPISQSGSRFGSRSVPGGAEAEGEGELEVDANAELDVDIDVDVEAETKMAGDHNGDVEVEGVEGGFWGSIFVSLPVVRNVLERLISVGVVLDTVIHSLIGKN
jgi:hypothetical protein